jgi:hypothetical protein
MILRSPFLRPVPRCTVAAALLAAAGGCARRAPAGATPAAATPPASRSEAAAFAPRALEARLAAFADDSMAGREAGTEGARRAAAYLAAEVRRLGLEPAGDDGGYLQRVPLVRRAVAPGASLTVRGATFRPWADFAVLDAGVGMRSLDGAEVVYSTAGAGMLAGEAVAGRLVVLPSGLETSFTAVRRLARGPMARAAGIAVLGRFSLPPEAVARLNRGEIVEAAPGDGAPTPALLVLGERLSELLVPGGRPRVPGTKLGTVRGDVRLRDVPAPSYNVVARLPGASAARPGPHVAVGAARDHRGAAREPVEHDELRAFIGGVRPGVAEDEGAEPRLGDWPRVRRALDDLRSRRPARRDSIYNGADDDGSGSVGLLAIAEAFAASRTRPARSLLFVWHTGEELGMVGSRWFTDHPTVPLDSVVAQLNVDMIGRGSAADLTNGGPAYLQLIGSRRLSTELGELVDTVNRRQPAPFEIDYQYDASGHPAQYYCRSDHYMYARHAIPITFFSTGGHRDYHQVTDEVQYIDFDKLSRVARLIHDVGAAVADRERRVAVDGPRPNPRGECVQ